MTEERTSELPTRTWGKYPEIQRDHPYSDQCIEELIARYERSETEWRSETT